mmetsp:Transcript_35980/g.112996  ORF Transcript_35980/g.112996 Transcript_35980/m.112996 type:complete len:223 (-) Transcript_35980:285-953(-)
MPLSLLWRRLRRQMLLLCLWLAHTGGVGTEQTSVTVRSDERTAMSSRAQRRRESMGASHVITAAERAPAASGCRYVFLDIGANIGRHTEFLFEPKQFRNSIYVQQIFKPMFPEDRSRSDVCAFGFEPNPRHTARLRALQRRYAAQGFNATFYPMAASTNDAGLTFRHVDVARKPLETGFSTKLWPGTASEYDDAYRSAMQHDATHARVASDAVSGVRADDRR